MHTLTSLPKQNTNPTHPSARYEALKYYTPSFTTPLPTPCLAHAPTRTRHHLSPPKIYFNPSLDTLYVGEATYHEDLTTFLTSLPPSESQKIQALAITLCLAESSRLFAIDKLPALQELVYVTPRPHQFCILLRHRDIWFEDVEVVPGCKSKGMGKGKDRFILDSIGGELVSIIAEEVSLDRGGVADRRARKMRWVQSEGASVGVENYAEVFWVKMVGERGRMRSLVGEEEAWMPPGNCEYCRSHREVRISVRVERS